jgi:hypothetical protein
MRVVSLDPATGLLSNPSTGLNVRVDTLAPPTPALPDMDAASDTGISNTDNITRDNTPTFVGTVPANDIVRLLANGVLVGSDTSTSGGTWSITTSPLSDGSPIMTARFEDLAGNLSPVSGGVVSIIDTVAPAAPTVAPDLAPASDTGWSNTDNITRDATPTFTGTAPGNHIVRLQADGVSNGFVQLPVGVTTYNVTSTGVADGNRAMSTRFEDLAGNTSAVGPLLPVRIDTVRPALVNQSFNFLTANEVHFTFSEDVSGGIGVTNFSLTDVTNNVSVPNSSLAMSYLVQTATISFPGFAGGILTDADWELKANGDINDVAGNNFPGTIFDFFFLRGDANRDRRVNLQDFNILASNFGQTPRNFSQGDFNYDTVVNLQDFNILASRFGTALAARSAPAGGSAEDPFDELEEPAREELNI